MRRLPLTSFPVHAALAAALMLGSSSMRDAEGALTDADPLPQRHRHPQSL